MSISLGGEFRRVGPEVPFGTALVAYDDVLPLRDLVAQNFTPAASTSMTEVTLDATTSAGALFFREIGDAGLETPSRSIAAMVTHESVPDGWRLLAKVATFDPDVENVGNKIALYRIETFGDEVLQATKAIGRILEKSRIIVEEDQLIVRWTKYKRMFEKRMTAEDCAALGRTLGSAVKRAPYRTRDPAIDNVCWIPGEFAA